MSNIKEKTSVKDIALNYANAIKPNEVRCVSARYVANNKVSIEFAEIIRNPTLSISAASFANRKDPRFSSQPVKPKRGWLVGDKEELEEMLSIDLTDLTEDEDLYIGITNPKMQVGPWKGMPFHVQVVEHIDARNEYQMNNTQDAAKSNPEKTRFFLHKDNYIFVTATVVIGEPNHIWLKSDGQLNLDDTSLPETQAQPQEGELED